MRSVIGSDPKDRRRKPNTIPIIALINRPCAGFTVKKKINNHIKYSTHCSVLDFTICMYQIFSQSYIYTVYTLYTVHTTHCLCTRVLYTYYVYNINYIDVFKNTRHCVTYIGLQRTLMPGYNFQRNRLQPPVALIIILHIHSTIAQYI